jgi:type I restriction enzyme R subunit
VLSDEAHRSDEGVAGINLQSSLGNAFFFGFTGTPIDKKQLNTHRNYGADGERYLDYYSIQEAIDDGATLPVTYEARLSKFAIDESNLDEQFLDMTGDLSDEGRNELLKKYTKKSALVKLDKRVEMIARDIAEHYKLYVQPSGFKAQVVCYDREATALYKKAFDSLLPPDWSAVVYSSGDPNTDAVSLKEYNTSKRERDEIIRNFKNPEHPLKLILVCDMLLTGFDAPIEQVMYLDKPLRDHTLLQAIARTNRVYPNKEAGKIIDYYGITRNLHDALDFDEDIIDSAMIDIEVMKEKFEERMNEIMELFGDVNIEDPSNENLRKNLRIFIDNEDKQAFFLQRYNRLKSLFEFLSPDPFLKRYVRRFEWLTSFYIAFQKEFRSGEDSHILSAYGGKVQALIKEAVNYEGITKNFRELNISDIYELNRRKDMSEEEKAMNMEKILKQEISEQLDVNPVFQSFSERLKKIKEDFEGHQMDLSDRIKEYDKLFSDMRDANAEARKHGFDMREYGMYMTLLEQLEQHEEVGLKSFIRDISDTVQDLLDEGWRDSSKRDIFLKDIRKILQEKMWKEYKEALGGDTTGFSKVMNRLVDIIQKSY